MSVPIVARAYRSVSDLARRAYFQLQKARPRRRCEAAPAGREREPIGGPLDQALALLRSEGCAILRRQALLPLLSRRSRAVLETMLKACADKSAAVQTIRTSDELFAQQPELYLLGLDDTLLEAAENYLDAEPLYLGAALKREAADGRLTGARHWHRDREDERMFRVIVYLSNAGLDAGPFEYVPAQPSEAAARAHDYRSGYLDERRAAVMAPPELRRHATGSAGDAVIFDGIRIFHRASLPARQDRLSLTLTYVSRQPRLLDPRARLTRPAAADLKAQLTARQYACLPKPLAL